MSRPRTSLIGLGVGLAAAGVGAAVGLAAERIAVGRPVIRRFPQDDGEVPLGSLRDVPVQVVADDGVVLHAEIDPVAESAPPASNGGRSRRSAEDADPLSDITVVFCHGYALNLDSWHYQRLSMQGRVRCVYWDQRGHGRSESGARGHSTIPQLGRDLARVIAETAPTGHLVLVGHSMGGMTVLSFARQFPEIVQERVAGVALIATSSGDLAGIDLGLDKLGSAVHRLAPRALNLLVRSQALVERTRRIGSDLEEVIVKRWSYASDVDEELIDFTARMIASTRLDTVSHFLPQFSTHDEAVGLAVLAGLPALVLTGDHDLMIPPEHSQVLADALPGCEYAVVKESGHLVMLEHPDVVTPHLVALLRRVRQGLEVEARPVKHRRRSRPRLGRAPKEPARAPKELGRAPKDAGSTAARQSGEVVKPMKGAKPRGAARRRTGSEE